ncbi:hypothetical protein [Streptomyces sp. NPDC056304]|uniref:hypothetical protein n=1 Tax=Streptomyces sp. NPDC056304 TaxID=3345778 RepID=UPI0035DBFB10
MPSRSIAKRYPAIQVNRARRRTSATCARPEGDAPPGDAAQAVLVLVVLGLARPRRGLAVTAIDQMDKRRQRLRTGLERPT